MTEQDPTQWFGGRPRVMFVHAHPDDETISTGGTLAALAAAGLEPLLITLTRGEQGEVTPGPFQHLQGTDALAPHRQQELAAAIAMLGVERHAFLGVPPARAEGLSPMIYEDSGMEWGPDGRATAAADASAEALTRAPAMELLNDLLAAAYQGAAGAIVSYDDGGGYGHPDHVLAHRLSRAVAQALGVPFWEIVAGGAQGVEAAGAGGAGAAGAAGVAGAAGAGAAHESDPAPRAGDDGDADPAPLVEAHDVSPWLDRKTAALRMHGTQLTVDGDDIVHVGGQRQPIDRVEVFRLIRASAAAE